MDAADLDQLKKLESGESIPTRTVTERPKTMFGSFAGLFSANFDSQLPTSYVETEEEARMSGWERIRAATSQFVNGEDNFEFYIISNTVSSAALVGFVIGGFAKRKTTLQDYIRKHNTNIFKGKFEANRRLVDQMYLSMFRHGIRFGARFAAFTGLFMTAITLTALYDNCFRYHHSALAGGLATAAWRLPMGPRAMAVSSVLGATMGVVYAGTLNLYLNGTGTTMAGYRHIFRLGSEEG